MLTAHLPWRHALLALLVVAVWGTNFVVIRFALQSLPPLGLAAVRFLLAAVPAVFFVPRPAASWTSLAAYGVLIGAGQFGLLFLAMSQWISPGLASLVVQTQVFFTIGWALWTQGERMRPLQWLALILAALGLWTLLSFSDGSATPAGLGLVLLAALCWAAGNHVAKQAGRIHMLGYVVWSSGFAVPPLLLLSWWFEGPTALTQGLASADAATWVAVVWQTVGNTLFGYAAWAWLLARYPAATVSPLALGVPVFGMAASAWWMGESMPVWKLSAAGLVMLGLILNFLPVRRP
jgi:O-acetylserine/cysteine efflux transporter